MNFAGGSGSSSFPSPNLTLISHALAADKKSPSRWFDRNSRARRFNLLGAPKAHRNTLVSSKYFTAFRPFASSLLQEKQLERLSAVARRSHPQSSGARSRSPVPDVPSVAQPEPSAPREPHDWQ